MYPIPPGEHLVENRTCRHCQASFPITDKDMEFYEKVSPVFPKPPGEGDLSKAKKCKAGMSKGQGGSVSFPLDKGFESALLAASYGEAGKGDLVFGKSEQNPPGSPLDRGVRKYLIPPPTLCPDCRQQRRLSFRNERKLYKRKCDATGKDIISIYSPDKPYKVYHQDYWWSDKWDPMDYGREFDFGRSAFEQMSELTIKVPRLGLFNGNSCINCDYANQIYNCKDCYLIYSCQNDEGVMYGKRVIDCSDCIDIILCTGSNNCYETIDVSGSTNCFFSESIQDSSDIYYSYNCIGCSECILCSNLRNKRFYIRNEEYSEQEYKNKKREFLHNKRGINKDLYLSITQGTVHKNLNLSLSENSIGNDIQSSKNSYHVWDGSNLEGVKFSQFIKDIRNCYDLDYCCCESDFSYEISTGGVNMHGSLFSVDIWPEVQYIYYSDSCSSSHHLFLCTGLRNASYCILNKQYTKEEYEELVPRIIEHMSSPRPSPKGEGDGISSLSLKETSEERSACTTILKLEQSRGLGGEVEWGEFFPSSLSPFGYNETVAQEYFPIPSPQPSPKGEGASETETFRKVWIPSSPSPSGEGARGGGSGFWCNWSDYEPPFPKVDKIIPAEKLPDDISKIPDDILNWAIECEVTRKPFRIIKQELEFYRKHNLPIPRRHPDQRHLDRMKLRNPRKLYERLCDCPQCETNNKTSTLSSSEGGSLPLGKGFSQSENDKGGVHTSREQIPHFELNPKTGTRTKKIITTYSPERKEIVYCEECYNREVY